MDAVNDRYLFLLQQCSKSVLQEFIHSCIDGICGRKGPSYTSYKSVTEWTFEDYELAVQGITKLYRKAVSSKWSKEKVLEEVSHLSSDHQQCILTCYAVRLNDIRAVLLQETCAISAPYLQDFDWKLQWVMGSSKISSLQEPLLSVDFHLKDSNSHQSTTSVELDSGELKKMVAVLEQVEQAINQ